MLTLDQLSIGRENWTNFLSAVPPAAFTDIDGSQYKQRVATGLTAAFSAQGELDPYRIEEWLGQASEGLDRCLSYERDYHALRVQAGTAMAEAELFQSHADASEALEADDRAQAMRELERAAQQNAAGAFGDQDPLRAGFRELATGAATALAEASIRDGERTTHAHAKWAALRRYWSLLVGRYTEPGGAMHFSERAQSVLNLLENELSLVSPRLFAIEIGVRHIFGIDHPFPREGATISSTVLWLRKVMDSIEVKTRDQSVFDLMIPLRRYLGGRDSAVIPGDWDTMVNGTGNGLTFSLNGYLPAWITNVRLRAVGVSYFSNEDETSQGAGRNIPGYIYRAAAKYPVILIPPDQPNPYTDQAMDKISRAAAILYAEFQPLDGTVPANMIRSPSVMNINPAAGDWSLRLSKSRVHQFENQLDRPVPALGDLYLHVTLAADIDTGAIQPFSL